MLVGAGGWWLVAGWAVGVWWLWWRMGSEWCRPVIKTLVFLKEAYSRFEKAYLLGAPSRLVFVSFVSVVSVVSVVSYPPTTHQPPPTTKEVCTRLEERIPARTPCLIGVCGCCLGVGGYWWVLVEVGLWLVVDIVCCQGSLASP